MVYSVSITLILAEYIRPACKINVTKVMEKLGRTEIL